MLNSACGVINKTLLLLWLANGVPFDNQTQRNKRGFADDFSAKGANSAERIIQNKSFGPALARACNSRSELSKTRCFVYFAKLSLLIEVQRKQRGKRFRAWDFAKQSTRASRAPAYAGRARAKPVNQNNLKSSLSLITAYVTACVVSSVKPKEWSNSFIHIII